MKQFLTTTAACFSALLLFALLAVAAVIVIPYLEDGPSDHKEPYVRTDSPTGFKFIDHAQFAETDTVAVRGVLQNTSEITWVSAYIKLTLKSNGKILNTCDGIVWTMNPGSKRPFLIECKDIQPPAPAQRYEYDLAVDYAMHEG